MDEDQTICVLERLYTWATGVTCIGRALGGRRGYDAAFEHEDGTVHAFEVKGLGSTNKLCERRFDDGFARIPQIAYGRKLLRDLKGNLRVQPPDYVSLAVPYGIHYRFHSNFFLHAFQALGYGLYFVHEDRLEIVVEPRLIVRQDDNEPVLEPADQTEL